MKKDKAKILMTIFIVFLMVFSILEVVLIRQGENTRFKYKNNVFSKTQDKWVTYLGNKPLILTYSPKDLEQVQTIKITLNDLNLAQKIYISQNYQESIKFMQMELLGNLQQFLIPNLILSCSQDNEECPNIPVKTCNDATPEQKFILFKQSEQSEISYENNCLIIQGNNEEIIKKIDKLLLDMLLG